MNQFEFSVQTKWINLSTTYKVLNDHLYFDNITNDITNFYIYTDDKEIGWCLPSDNSGKIYVNSRGWTSDHQE